MSNTEGAEGVIQFAYTLARPQGPALLPEPFADLSAWRSILRSLDLLGQDPARYDGAGYGNMSLRDDDAFVVTASQTGADETLTEAMLTRITHCNVERFWVEAEGTQPPSSEALTHGMIYAADPRMRCIFHVHSPELWQQRDALNLPATAADVGYGSPQMSAAVSALLDEFQSRPLVFATAGHEDGIFACATNPRDCGGLLVTYLAKARSLALAKGGEPGSVTVAEPAE